MLIQLMIATVALCATPEAPEAGEAPYRNDPAVLAKLRNLAPGTAVELDPASMAGDGLERWREIHYRHGPGGRDRSVKMAYNPARRTAFYCGADRTAPHRLNDAWEYHLGSNTWHLLAPPDGDDPSGAVSPDGSLAAGGRGEAFVRNSVKLTDGQLLAPRGGPLAPSHTWDGLACDGGGSVAMWCAPGSGVRPDQLEAAYARTAGLTAAEVRSRLTPGLTDMWLFDFATRRWQRCAGRGATPRMVPGGSLSWMPGRNRAVYYCPEDRSLWLFDPATRAWEQTPASGRNRPGAGLVTAVNSREQKMLCVLGQNSWLFDFAGGKWERLASDPRNRADSSNSVLGYDAKTDRFVLYQGEAAADRVRTLSASDGVWRTSAVRGDPEPQGLRTQGYCDPDHGVLVICRDLRVWVCRPDGAATRIGEEGSD